MGAMAELIDAEQLNQNPGVLSDALRVNGEEFVLPFTFNHPTHKNMGDIR